MKFTDTLPEPRIRVVRGAVIVPETGTPDLAHGVFDARANFLPLSKARLSRDRISGVPAYAEPTTRLRGTYLYAGFGHHHFGHFILESLARVWALSASDIVPDGLLMPARHGLSLGPPLPPRLAPAAARFCGDLPFHIIKEPTRVDRLILPSPGFGHGPWLNGTKAFHDHMRNRLADISVDGAERLYLSRRELRLADKHVDREDEIIEMMKQAGYLIFEPQAFHLDIQLGVMRAARQIVGADGTAFHLAPLAMRRDAQAAIYLRRNRPEMLDYLARQMEGFAGVTPLKIDARRRPLSKITPAPIDMDVLRGALQKGGFL
ncbi:MAG: glycosyltransferase family 61 protein [Tateyamaria sp.]|uniref:glycosyltransferase 61 family protein n=1 Tax=Tateyamaria sp. TaxID=1929288 RepID=UPI003285E014